MEQKGGYKEKTQRKRTKMHLNVKSTVEVANGSNNQKEKYQAYLLTEDWEKLKEKVKKRDKHKCRVCGSKHSLEVHHKTYNRIYDEDISDLILLCKYHHSRTHGISPTHEKIILALDAILRPIVYLIFIASMILYKIKV